MRFQALNFTEMSYPESQSTFMSPQHSYQSGSDAIGIWPQFNSDEQFDPQLHFDLPSQFEHYQPPLKRPKNSDDNNVQSMNVRMPLPSNLPINKGTTNIFFKTRMCAKFRTGNCRNGENCNFAHGMQDLRQPPPNWQELVGVVRGKEDRPESSWDDDQRIIHKMKLCKKFYNGEECPYGDRCNFLHEDPSKFREDGGNFRESSAISIGTTVQPVMNGSGGMSLIEVNKPLNSANLDAFRANVKPVYWKTKLCTKWETTGHCPFGEKCHFAHGQAELQMPSGRAEGEIWNAASVSTKPPPHVATNISPGMTANVPGLVEEGGQGKKCLLKWKASKKINRIYGDWLDDMPLGQSLTNQVES